MKNKVLATLLAAAMVLALAACGGAPASSAAPASAAPASSEAPAPEASSEAPAADPAEKFADGKLVIGSGSDLLTTDPADQNQTNTQDLFRMIGSQLFKRDLDFEIVPDLCVSYEQPDDVTWVFTLREDAVFNNGDPLTAEDVAFTFDRLIKDESLVGHSYCSSFESVEVLEPYVVKLTTKSPRPDMLTLVSMAETTIVPKKYIEENGIEEYMKLPVTSGAYQMTEWVPDDHYTIVPFDGYYGDDKATWKEVTYRPIPESSTRVSELLTGGVDVIYNVPVNEWERVGSGDTHLDYGETSRVMLLITRLTEGTVTADPKVRQAIEMAIDKTAICEQLLQGAGTPTRTRVGSSVPGFNNDLFGAAADLYDPEGAKALLEEAGYKPGDITVTFTSPSGRYLMDTEMSQMIAAYLEAVGIHANLELVDSTVMSNMFNDKTNKELFMIGLSDGQYDGCYPLAHYGDKERVAGQTDYDNPKAQELYQKALVESDPAQKEAYEREIQAIAAEDRPHICIAQLKAVFGVDNGLVITPRMDSNGMADEISVAK